ncbi:hypothetical protein [Nocardia sp. NPDC057353]|uniref:hypothetical protein n=1 Tax=Nocardia sp. NPDC057353 TaxID=3346104 RepID=UPI00362CCF3A
MMTYVNLHAMRLSGVKVDYSAARVSTSGGYEVEHSAVVDVHLGRCHEVYVSLSIEDARALLAALPGVLAEHDAAEAATTDTTTGDDAVDAGKAA